MASALVMMMLVAPRMAVAEDNGRTTFALRPLATSNSVEKMEVWPFISKFLVEAQFLESAIFHVDRPKSLALCRFNVIWSHSQYGPVLIVHFLNDAALVTDKGVVVQPQAGTICCEWTGNVTKRMEKDHVHASCGHQCRDETDTSLHEVLVAIPCKTLLRIVMAGIDQLSTMDDYRPMFLLVFSPTQGSWWGMHN